MCKKSYHITQYLHYWVMWKTLLGTWIPLGLHLDQSHYIGWVLKPSAHNSITVLLRYIAYNPIFVVSSYLQALLTLRVLEYGVMYKTPRHLDSSWTASGSVQLYGLGVEAQCT